MTSAERRARGRRAGCGGGRKMLPRCCCWRCSCASSCRSSARYVFNYPLGWTDEVSVIVLDLVRACGARPSSCAKGTKSASTSSTARSSAQTRRVFTVITGMRDRALFGIALPGRHRLCDVHEGRAVGLSRHSARLSLFDLRPVLVGVIVRYAALTWRALRGQAARTSRSASGSAL